MKQLLEPSKIYHIYNHANGTENLFVNEGNYEFFLKKYNLYISPIANTLAYCLMPNHFHIAIKLNSFDEIYKIISATNKEIITEDIISKYISKQFARLFGSYGLAFNKQQNRMGALFIPKFHRKEVDSDEYLKELIFYIHFNPIHHDFVEHIEQWKHSSYLSLINKRTAIINLSNDVFNWFTDVEDFINFHNNKADAFKFNHLDSN